MAKSANPFSSTEASPVAEKLYAVTVLLLFAFFIF